MAFVFSTLVVYGRKHITDFPQNLIWQDGFPKGHYRISNNEIASQSLDHRGSETSRVQKPASFAYWSCFLSFPPPLSPLRNDTIGAIGLAWDLSSLLDAPWVEIL